MSLAAAGLHGSGCCHAEQIGIATCTDGFRVSLEATGLAHRKVVSRVRDGDELADLDREGV